MPTTPRRLRALAATFLLVVAGLGAAATPAQADPDIPITWTVDASTTLAKLGLTVDVPPGTFDGSVDLGTGELEGDLTLPPATTRMRLLGLPLADATFAMTQTQPIDGTVDLAAGTVTANASFEIALTSLRPTIFPINLVGSRCKGSAPVQVTMSGPINLAGESTFTATYTIPPFKNCGLATPIINKLVAGPGNTFTATFGPTTP